VPVLRVEGVTRRFGGVTAVKEVSFQVHEAQIKALIGPNGAGKTTLFNLVSAIDRPDDGRILFRNPIRTGDAQIDLARTSPHRASRAGIGRTFQHSQIFEELSVLDNVKVGRHAHGRAGLFSAFLTLPRQRREEAAAEEAARRALQRAGLGDKTEIEADSLPLGERHLLEIARALATEPGLLLLDEPAAGLNNEETERLAETVRRIRDDGVTVLLVEHDMGFVMEVSDEVVVLDYGEKIAEGSPLMIRSNPEVIRAYLGEDYLAEEEPR